MMEPIAWRHDCTSFMPRANHFLSAFRIHQGIPLAAKNDHNRTWAMPVRFLIRERLLLADVRPHRGVRKPNPDHLAPETHFRVIVDLVPGQSVGKKIAAPDIRLLDAVNLNRLG